VEHETTILNLKNAHELAMKELELKLKEKELELRQLDFKERAQQLELKKLELTAQEMIFANINKNSSN
jgi:hypothetical protein